jgi:hypothetical protein
MLFLIISLLGCMTAQEVSAQGAKPKPKEEETPVVPKTGGYSEIDVKDKKAVEAYEFLKQELASRHPEFTLLAAKKAFSQVVAGFKIRLICEYLDSQKQERQLSAFVYIDPSGNKRMLELNLDYTGD